MITRIIVISLCLFLSCAPLSLAAGVGAPDFGGTSSGVTLTNPLGPGTTLPVLLSEILKFVVRIGAIVVVLMLVYVGFLYVKARGNSEELRTVHRALLYTILGALILLGAQAIAIGICETTKALSSGGSTISCTF